MSLDYQNVPVLFTQGVDSDDDYLLPPGALVRAENAKFVEQSSIARAEGILFQAGPATSMVRGSYHPEFSNVVEALRSASIAGAMFANTTRLTTPLGSNTLIRASPGLQSGYGGGIWAAHGVGAYNAQRVVVSDQSATGTFGVTAYLSNIGTGLTRVALNAGQVYPIATKVLTAGATTWVLHTAALNGSSAAPHLYCAVFDNTAFTASVDLGAFASATAGAWDAVLHPSDGTCTVVSYDGSNFYTASVSSAGVVASRTGATTPTHTPLANIAARWVPGSGSAVLLAFFGCMDSGKNHLAYYEEGVAASTLLGTGITAADESTNTGRVAVNTPRGASSNHVVVVREFLSGSNNYTLTRESGEGVETVTSSVATYAHSLEFTGGAVTNHQGPTFIRAGGIMLAAPVMYGEDADTEQGVLLHVHREGAFEAREQLMILRRGGATSAFEPDVTLVANYECAPSHNQRLTNHPLPLLYTSGNSITLVRTAPTYVSESTNAEPRTRGAVLLQELSLDAPFIGVCRLPGRSLMAGAAPLEVSNLGAGHSGHPSAPFITSAASLAGGSGLLDATSYYTRCTYATLDSQGLWCESAPSSPKLVSGTAANHDYTLRIASAPLDRPTRLRVYRTAGGAGPGGSYLFDYDTELANGAAITVNVVANTDALLASQPPAYWMAEATNRPAPPCGTVVIHQDRLVATDGYSIRTTKAFAAGYAYEWLDVASGGITLAPELGRVCWIVSQVDRLVVGCEYGVGVVTGSGAGDDGQGSSFSAVTPVPAAIISVFGRWCAAAAVSDGIWVASSEGVRFLNTGLQESRRENGAPVGSESDEGAPCSAIVHPRSVPGVACFQPSATATSFKVPDAYTGAWTTLLDSSKAATSAWAGDTGTYVLTATHKGTIGYLLPPESSVTPTMVVETPWLKLQGIQDFQRVSRLTLLGKMKLASGGTTAARGEVIKIEVASNYEPTWTTLVAAQKFVPVPSVDGSFGRIDVEAQVGAQKCESFKVRISTYGTGADEFRITGLTLRIGLKRGRFKRSRNPGGT